MQFFSSVVHLLTGHTLCLTSGGLLGFESCYRSRNKDGSSWGVGPEESQQHLARQLLRTGHYSFLRQSWANLFRRGEKGCKEHSAGFKGLVSPAASGSAPMSPFQSSGSCSFPDSALCLTECIPCEVENSVCFVIQLLVG